MGEEAQGIRRWGGGGGEEGGRGEGERERERGRERERERDACTVEVDGRVLMDALPLQGKEGGFVVRNSSRENMYTLSIW